MAGVLIGVERERMQLGRSEFRARSIPGVRSFGLISIYGCLAAVTSTIVAGGDSLVWSIVFTASTLGLALFLLVYMYTTMPARRAPGITTYMVILVAYMVGVLAGVGRLLEAASISVLATLLLALKNPAVALAKAISYEELIAIMEVAALAIIIGPLIAAYSPEIPWIDVYRVYVFFLLVLAMSLLSYGAARIWGPRGLVYGAALGSLVNSEATIASSTRLIGVQPVEVGVKVNVARTIVLLVTSVMQARASLLALASIALFTSPWGLVNAIPLVLLLIASTAIASLAFTISLRQQMPPITVASPISWYTAVKAAVTYTILISLAKLLELLQAPGLAYIPLVAIGGFVNATATILSLASVVTTIGVAYTTTLALIAITTATLNKIVYADRSNLEPQAFKTIIRTSIIMALIPLTLALVQTLSQMM